METSFIGKLLNKFFYLRIKPLSLRFLQKRYKAMMRKASIQKASLFNNSSSDARKTLADAYT